MGGGEEDQQKLKSTAAAAYDYENDPRWADYWSNILIPPHMASRSDVVDHFKRKFYQRYIVFLSCGIFFLILYFNSVVILVVLIFYYGLISYFYCILKYMEFQRFWLFKISEENFNSAFLLLSSFYFLFLFFSLVLYIFAFNIVVTYPEDPGLVVEPMTTSSSSQPARPSAAQPSSSSSSTPSNNQPRQRNSGQASRTSGTSTTPTSNPTSLRWDRKTIQFSVNAWVFVVAVLSIFPLTPANLSNRAYRLSFLGTACSSLYSLYSVYGKPRAWNLQAVQVWLQSVIVTKDFISFIYCLTFVTSHLYLKFSLIPVICRSLDHVGKFLRRNFSRSSLYRKYLEEACVWVESNVTTLNILSSQAEIGLGFLLVVSLLSWQRNIIQTFMYWQILKLMYHAPATAGYHQSVWAKIGGLVNPVVQHYVPFLNTPISTIQRWWFR